MSAKSLVSVSRNGDVPTLTILFAPHNHVGQPLVSALKSALPETCRKGGEPEAIGPELAPFFTTGYADLITIANSVISSLKFPNYIAAMRRPNLNNDPRFSTAEFQTKNIGTLYAIIRQWFLSFHNSGALDAQLDDMKLTFSVRRSVKKFADSERANGWVPSKRSLTEKGRRFVFPESHGSFQNPILDPLRKRPTVVDTIHRSLNSLVISRGSSKGSLTKKFWFRIFQPNLSPLRKAAISIL